MLVGKAEGEARGETTATRRLIVTLLGHRFDAVPVTLATRLKNITDMDALATAILKVESLEAFEALVDKTLKGDGSKD